jgi:hypothetical protein
MRCLIILRNGGAMERAAAALAKFRYHAGGDPVAPEGHPSEWKNWLLEIDSAELDTVREHVDEGDIVDMKPVSEPASFQVH